MLRPTRVLLALLVSFLVFGHTPISVANAEEDWVITQPGTGFQYDTQTAISSRKGVSREGLISVSRSGKNLMQSYWQRGAHRVTVEFNGRKIVDGYDLLDVSRIKSFRFDKSGSTVYIKTTKGPKAVVELYQDGHVVLTWPRLSLVNVLGYRDARLFISVYVANSQTTEFWRYARLPDGSIQPEGQQIGSLRGCALLSSKVVKDGIAMEAYCDAARGSDVKFLEFASGKILDIKATGDDEFLAYSFMKNDRGAKYDKGKIPVLSVTGNNNGRQFYHALSASFLKLLGEPMAYASDEAGTQSWSQSYRTRTLATLYEKTGHTAFATLAQRAMKNTLNQQNSSLKISGKFNPSCAWASRIYSNDGMSPISFMVNQAMISQSLISSCDSLGGKCEPALRKSIEKNATCLIGAYEKWFDRASGLYRIPYGAPFRFDGIWAPWNWHMMWSAVLQHVGEANGDAALKKRASNIISSFVQSWEMEEGEDGRALWRYWPAPYYLGWQESDQVSKSRPRQKPRNMAKERYEDLNHAGISLLGLAGSKHELTPHHRQAVRKTIDHLLQTGNLLPRDMDGQGPVSPRWLPGAGWHMFASQRMQDLYAHKLPGGVSSDQHLAYALLYRAEDKFDLKLTVSQCTVEVCTVKENWSYQGPKQFLSENPLVHIRRKMLTERSRHTRLSE